ncbi:MAG: tRNA (adenosine(37)-N6)-threonylcarbamoyltransferase complex transferase subunit TsaD [Candidatus Magasanikbacteria bacterium]|jgi:N6-L-threonylcarbamoyladenine synthase|nr:tRNA (adenosine(37)-N6)-threonylcarbamoyltransferase complex transferase subunit TsaD [Candidatus Magasanikbacteria bacterium]MBT4221171.1 tRNA (adenosine(37)-N6)-threonylcarbamoyltransferase complex transferase subunit TsaD [Candidatus Magasanikbacteria bacterium]MBT4350259.1 tRNA (adenosine(37)-N6)-threonylcarbamoyltransferase complex transferase subunit TsaD [Candidatus Magasanikbacteria bacterium]MBT4541686.1 tRNA (adenosine(37)-N6)-threonylcarbamoyltransferase complex transferase subunit
MNILGIESSCDDTSAALVSITDGHFSVLSEKTASQIEVHKKYGGVVPEIAGRKHAEHIFPVIEEVLQHQIRPDAIAVTTGPGLITGLLVGVEAAKSLSYLLDIPVVSTNHIEGHIYSTLLKMDQKEILFPALCLIVSGGHTELILMKAHGVYERIGGTRDDAAGECFDKIAKMLDRPYPGGPEISRLATNGNPSTISFPRPMINSDNYDFSFSGLKTAALYWLRDNTLLNDADTSNFCASVEQAIVDVLLAKTKKAIEHFSPQSLILAGGVSANQKLRETLQHNITDIPLFLPPKKYAMDNATMIAVAGYFHAKEKHFTNWKDLEANPNWKLYSS